MIDTTKATNRKFGVEIEFNTLRNGVVADLQNTANVDIVVERWNTTTRNHWKVITDSSCGRELVSPILQGASGLEDLERALAALNRLDPVVNSRCGVHVHLDTTGLTALDIKWIVKRYNDFEGTIDSWMPRSRRGDQNRYTRSVARNVNMNRVDNMDDDTMPLSSVARHVNANRWSKVNLTAINKHGTIEFRHHGASTDFEKIGNWVLFLQHFVESSRKIKTGGGLNATYRPHRKAPFAEIREQVEMFGATLKYVGTHVRGGKGWKLTLNNGEETIFSNIELDQFYIDEGNEFGNRRELKAEAAITISRMVGTTTIDTSLMAGVPDTVVEFFNRRADQLAA